MMNYATRVKICATCSLDDALLAQALGADALGFIFYPPSPRHIEIDQAAQIIKQLPPFITTVGVFVNPDAEYVRKVVNRCGIDLLQMHGMESGEYCRSLQHPYIKTISMRDSPNWRSLCKEYHDAKSLLLDSYHPDIPGGTGQSFNWSLVPQSLDLPIILAGGLTADNVVSAIEQVKPYAVDVVSGVEAEKGQKDPEKLYKFMHNIRTITI